MLLFHSSYYMFVASAEGKPAMKTELLITIILPLMWMWLVQQYMLTWLVQNFSYICTQA